MLGECGGVERGCGRDPKERALVLVDCWAKWEKIEMRMQLAMKMEDELKAATAMMYYITDMHECMNSMRCMICMICMMLWWYGMILM